MVENYTKDIKESVYHGAVVSALAVGYTMLGKTLVKMNPPSLSKFDIEVGIKLVTIVAISIAIGGYLLYNKFKKQKQNLIDVPPPPMLKASTEPKRDIFEML